MIMRYKCVDPIRILEMIRDHFCYGINDGKLKEEIADYACDLDQDAIDEMEKWAEFEEMPYDIFLVLTALDNAIENSKDAHL